MKLFLLFFVSCLVAASAVTVELNEDEPLQFSGANYSMKVKVKPEKFTELVEFTISETITLSRNLIMKTKDYADKKIQELDATTIISRSLRDDLKMETQNYLKNLENFEKTLNDTTKDALSIAISFAQMTDRFIDLQKLFGDKPHFDENIINAFVKKINEKSIEFKKTLTPEEIAEEKKFWTEMSEYNDAEEATKRVQNNLVYGIAPIGNLINKFDTMINSMVKIKQKFQDLINLFFN